VRDSRAVTHETEMDGSDRETFCRCCDGSRHVTSPLTPPLYCCSCSQQIAPLYGWAARWLLGPADCRTTGTPTGANVQYSAVCSAKTPSLPLQSLHASALSFLSSTGSISLVLSSSIAPRRPEGISQQAACPWACGASPWHHRSHVSINTLIQASS
jgi:hypothetical protein